MRCTPAAARGGSKSDGFTEQQDNAAPGLGFGVEDEQAVDGTGLSVDLHGAAAFQWEAVLFDAPQRGAQVGHYLLRSDDPDRAEGTAGVPGKLASAGRSDHQGAGFGDRVDAAHDDVGGGHQPPDLSKLSAAVHGLAACPDGVVPPAGVDVLLDAGEEEGLAGAGEHAGTRGNPVLDAVACRG